MHECPKMLKNSQRLALTTLFGATIFVFKMLLPSPLDKALILFQTIFLCLGYLLLGAPGGTYTSFIGGLLTAVIRGAVAPFTIIFALLYGVLIDTTSSIIKVREANNDVKGKRLIASATISTVTVALASFYTSVVFQLTPGDPLLEMGLLTAGVINGMIGGYLSAAIWKRIF